MMITFRIYTSDTAAAGKGADAESPAGEITLRTDAIAGVIQIQPGTPEDRTIGKFAPEVLLCNGMRLWTDPVDAVAIVRAIGVTGR